MRQALFGHAPAGSTELGIRVPTYFDSPSWWAGASLAWAGAIFVLALGTLSVLIGSVGSGAELIGNSVSQAYLTVIPALMAAILFRQGGIDLSFGPVAGASGVIMASLLYSGETVSRPAAVLAGMGAALLCGLVHAVLIGVLRLPGFLVTLPSMLIARGLVLQVTGGKSLFLAGRGISEESPGPLAAWGWAIVAALLVVGLLVAQFPGRRTAEGPPSMLRQALALAWPYLASSLTAGATGILLAFYIGAGVPSAGQGLTEGALVAVVLGGSWLAGRHANCLGALAAALLLWAVQTSMQVHNVSVTFQYMVQGVLFAVALAGGFVFHWLIALAYANRPAARVAAVPSAVPGGDGA